MAVMGGATVVVCGKGEVVVRVKEGEGCRVCGIVGGLEV
jgi:hypothetical protein